ncbi:hypothetical protein Cgig2_005826 [Carnegiea gigantea]|uniref:Uncharacterized protein n=1 Tax=Carnegiea gigantea TaxID=171969 RepID=A0A9Q1QN85_9CARY|nr:hypothetical protein Cgig2_005826 [Carnegiea gigantea]
MQAAEHVKATFMWCLRELVRPSQPLSEDYHSFCPDFNLEVAEMSTQDFHIPELTQAVFYATVLNDAVALGVSCGIMSDTLVPVLEWLNCCVFASWLETKREALRRVHSQRLTPAGANSELVGGQEEKSGQGTPLLLLVVRSRLRVLDLCNS